jgi:hypothetical protein
MFKPELGARNAPFGEAIAPLARLDAPKVGSEVIQRQRIAEFTSGLALTCHLQERRLPLRRRCHQSHQS